MSEDFASSGWYDLLMEGRIAAELLPPGLSLFERGFSLLPGDLRCRICSGPFEGGGAKVARAFGIKPSSFSMQLCGRCEVRARGEKTGAEVSIATLFADIRGSTELSQRVGSLAYRDLIDRFYTASTGVLIEKEAIIEQLVGDQVAAIFVPGFAGEDYVDQAIAAALDLQTAFGVGTEDGPWVDVGIGIDAGTAFVGVVGTLGGMTELTVLGDVPNLTARLAGAAEAGELLVTSAAIEMSHRYDTTQERTIHAKGFDSPVVVGVLTPGRP